MIAPKTYKNENVYIENENRTNMIHSDQLVVSDVKTLATLFSNVGNERYLAHQQWAMAAILCNNYRLPCWSNSNTYIGPDADSRLQRWEDGAQLMRSR